MRPLTDLRPKALVPINGRPLLDLALDRLEPLAGTGPGQLAVNAHHHADQIAAHLDQQPARVHLRVEHGEALGTAGAVAGLRSWLDGRAALVTNADAYLPGGLTGPAGPSPAQTLGPDPIDDETASASWSFMDGWDGERCRLLCTVVTDPLVRADFTGADGARLRYVGACLLPWPRIRDLAEVPSGLYEVLWRADLAAGALDLVRLPPGSVVIDCGTPADYLAANLHASGGASVIGAGATVLGRLERSVVWDGARVGPDEMLVDQIRAGDARQPLTVDAG